MPEVPLSDDVDQMTFALMNIIGRGRHQAWRTRSTLPENPRFASFASIGAAHKALCHKCRGHCECDTRDAIEYMLLRGVHPQDFEDGKWHTPTGVRVHFPSFIPCSPSEQAHLASTHARWKREGVATEPNNGHLDHPVSPAFVVTKRKAHADKQSEALAWALQHPDTVARSLEDQSLWPDSLFATKLRGVYSLKAANSRMAKPPMRYPTIHDISLRVQSAHTLAALDFTEGYTSLRIAPSAQDLFQCTVHGANGIRHCTVPFGWRGAPFVFCTLSAVLAQLLRAHCLPPG